MKHTTLHSTAGDTEANIATTQITLPKDMEETAQTGTGQHAVIRTTGTFVRESGADSRKRHGEVGLITDSQHRGD